jgi:hypothetical protein
MNIHSWALGWSIDVTKSRIEYRKKTFYMMRKGYQLI